MKKFTRTINGEKYQGDLFEENDIINKFGRTKEDWELINTYQKTFPQLLLNDTGDFVIDGEQLCKELGIKDNFNHWLTRETKGKEGKLVKYKCAESIDYINDGENPNVNFTKEEIENMNAKQRSRNGIKNSIRLTLKTAKKIAMRQNNEFGDLVCDYFILIEDILKDYETWVLIREPEKQGYKDMKKAITEWYVRNGFESDIEAFYIREANLLNQSLTGMRAIDIRHLRNVKDNKTRDNLTKEVNQCLANLQFLNTSLLNSNMSYSIRKEIIEGTCNSQYGYIKEMFDHEQIGGKN